MTPKQKAMLDAIEELTVDGVSPTYRDLGERLGIASTSNVHRLIHRLIEDGYLIHTDGRSRSLRVIGKIDGAAIATMPRDQLVKLRFQIDQRLRLSA